ncbi:hypothetical protein D3C86_1717990 [compost metagenome]
MIFNRNSPVPDDQDEVLAKMQAAIKKEEAKVKRCERLGLRHKNNLFTMIEKYKAECRARGIPV